MKILINGSCFGLDDGGYLIRSDVLRIKHMIFPFAYGTAQ